MSKRKFKKVLCLTVLQDLHAQGASEVERLQMMQWFLVCVYLGLRPIHAQVSALRCLLTALEARRGRSGCRWRSGSACVLPGTAACIGYACAGKQTVPSQKRGEVMLLLMRSMLWMAHKCFAPLTTHSC